MRILFFLVAFVAMVFFSAPVWASLPYYNAEIGYTIWLPKSWSEAPASYLEWAEQARKSLPVQSETSDWEAGYCSAAEGVGRSLLVEVKHGRKMHAADISNFNRFIVQSLTKITATSRKNRLSLKDATYFKEKKTLRLETETEIGGKPMLSLAYIVYTRKGMLTFVGYVDPGDEQAKATIDEAVLSLYLDDRIRY